MSGTYTREINALDELEFYYIGEDPDYQDRILYKDDLGYWHEFIVLEINAKRTKDIIKRCYAVDSFVETQQDFVDDKRAYDAGADTALSRMLTNSRFEVGRVSVSKQGNFNIYRDSPYNVFPDLLKEFECEFKTRIEVDNSGIKHRYIDLGDAIGREEGKRFTYSKDLIEVERIYEPGFIYTALNGYGKSLETEGGGHDRREDFSDINGGKTYVGDEEARERWGRPNNDGTRSHSFGKVIFDKIEDHRELLEATKKALYEQLKPKIMYKASVINLKAYGYDFEGVAVGDSVLIVDKTFEPELRIKARIQKNVTDLNNPDLMTLEIGSYTDVINKAYKAQAEAIQNITSNMDRWNKAANAFDADGSLKTDHMTNVFDAINKEFEAGQSYVRISKTNGLIIYDSPDPKTATKAVNLEAGGIRLSNKRKPNGEFDFNTVAITGDGINASTITAGEIKGANGHWNLETGDITLNNLQGSNADLSGTLTSGTYPKIKIEDGKINGYKSGTNIGTVDFDTWAFDNNGRAGIKDGLKIEAPAIFLNTDALFYAGKNSSYESNKMMDGYIRFVDKVKYRVVQDGDGVWFTAVGIHYSNIIVYGGLIKSVESDTWEGDSRAIYG